MNDEDKSINKVDPHDILLSWEAPEFEHHVRDVKWYIIASTFVLAFLAYSIYMKDWYFIGILAFLVVGIVVYLRHTPKIREYAITRVGIYIDDGFYSYDKINSFWIVYEDNVRSLFLILKKKYVPAQTILLDDQDPVLVRSILKKFVHEDEGRGENYADRIARRLRF